MRIRWGAVGKGILVLMGISCVLVPMVLVVREPDGSGFLLYALAGLGFWLLGEAMAETLRWLLGERFPELGQALGIMGMACLFVVSVGLVALLGFMTFSCFGPVPWFVGVISLGTVVGITVFWIHIFNKYGAVLGRRDEDKPEKTAKGERRLPANWRLRGD